MFEGRYLYLVRLVLQHRLTLTGTSFVVVFEVQHFDIFDERQPLGRIVRRGWSWTREASIGLSIVEENHCDCQFGNTNECI
jgi:hypothetical protein